MQIQSNTIYASVKLISFNCFRTFKKLLCGNERIKLFKVDEAKILTDTVNFFTLNNTHGAETIKDSLLPSSMNLQPFNS